MGWAWGSFVAGVAVGVLVMWVVLVVVLYEDWERRRGEEWMRDTWPERPERWPEHPPDRWQY